MILPMPPGQYNPQIEIERNRILEREAARAYRRQEDVEIVAPARLILHSPNGTRFPVEVDNSGAINGGGGSSWAIRILNATQAMVDDTSIQDWFTTASGLLLDADSTYEFEGNFFSLNGTTSHGLNMRFAAIAGAAIQWNSIGTKGIATTEATAHRSIGTNALATNRLVTTASTVGGNRVRVWGTIRTGAAGTLIPQVSQSAASGSFTVQPGTYFKARRIGSNTLTNTGEWA